MRLSLMPIVRLILLAVAWLGVCPAAGAAVLVTIKPVHSIVAAVTDGVVEPDLLLDGTVSPHLDRLRPSTLRSLRQADLVVWAGEGVETFLAPAITQLPEAVLVINLSQAGLPTQLPLRNAHSGHIDDHRKSNNTLDAHLWFDPHNAAAIADLVAAALVEIDPDNAQVYTDNSKRFKDSLAATVEKVQQQLSVVSDKPFLVFHDALQYFEKRFSLNNAGVVTYQPQVAASARHLRALQQLIKTQSIRCILTEPQLESRTVRSVVDNANLHYAVIDPLASQMETGAGLYEAWLFETATVIHDCLSHSAVKAD
jgi:zinc transport system substrate-binding protein